MNETRLSEVLAVSMTMMMVDTMRMVVFIMITMSVMMMMPTMMMMVCMMMVWYIREVVLTKVPSGASPPFVVAAS